MMRLSLIILGSSFLGALMSTLISYGDTNSLLSVTGGVVRTSHVNQYFQAFSQNVVPRNSSGVATSNAGELGTSSIPWKKASITTGYWSAGDIKCKHTYNGLLPIGQGWMRMDGDIVNQANYDAEHGAGSWATYIGASSLDGKFLPNMDLSGSGGYISARNTTTQDGSVAITSVGNTNHTVNLQHNHVVVGGRWYDFSAFDTGSGVRNIESGNVSGGILQFINGGANTGNAADRHGIIYGQCSGVAAPLTCLAADAYVQSTTSNNSLSPTQSIKPQSIEFVCYMRII